MLIHECFGKVCQIDTTYYDRAMKRQQTGSVIVGGVNYGQGSSREHAAIAPRYLGVRVVIAKSFARIHWQNLCNFGILPLTFLTEKEYATIDQEDVLDFPHVCEDIQHGDTVTVVNTTKNNTFQAKHAMTKRQVRMFLDGSVMKLYRG